MTCFLILLAAAGLGACAAQTSTRIASATDPAYQGHIFTSLVVEVESQLQERDIIERRAVVALQESGMTALPSLDILSPTRDYPQAVRKRKMGETGMQGLLVVTPADKRVIEEYIPPSYSRPRFPVHGGYGGGYGRGGFGAGFGYGFYEPGMIFREPQANYIASIYTLPKFERAWTGEFTVTGTNGMDFNDVAGRFAEIAIKRLKADGVIP